MPKDVIETEETDGLVTNDNGGLNAGSDSNSGSSDSESEHMLRLREFQAKLLASSNSTPHTSRSKNGRRHTLCLTR